MNLIRKILNAIFDTIYKICELFYNNKNHQNLVLLEFWSTT